MARPLAVSDDLADFRNQLILEYHCQLERRSWPFPVLGSGPFCFPFGGIGGFPMRHRVRPRGRA